MMASLPNWMRMSLSDELTCLFSSVLLVISLLSFLPQLRELWLRRNASGISPYYALFNLISATELFAVAFFYVINSAIQRPPASDVFVHNPPQLGDYLNLVQLASVWVLWLVIFAAVLLLPSEDGNHSSRGHNTASGQGGEGNYNNSGALVRNFSAGIILSIYFSFLLISLIPLIVDAARPSQDASYHKWALALFHGVHAIFINPIVTVLTLMSLFVQRDEILRHPPGTASSSLSLVGLAMQAAVFALLAIAWIWRLVLHWDRSIGEYPITGVAWAWYQLVGFVVVDHAAFALVQAVLLAIARRHDGQRLTGTETEPLLASM